MELLKKKEKGERILKFKLMIIKTSKKEDGFLDPERQVLLFFRTFLKLAIVKIFFLLKIE